MAVERKKVLFLFDVDGTLTPARLKCEDWLKPWLAELRGTTYYFEGNRINS